jgi:sec-independent protein translocase protein TatB
VFEVGFSELLVIAIVALVVLGPERLPKAARMAGTFMRKARQSFEGLKNEVERELAADELRKRLAEIQAAPAALAESIMQPLQETSDQINLQLQSLTQDVPKDDAQTASPDAAQTPEPTEGPEHAPAPSMDASAPLAPQQP